MMALQILVFLVAYLALFQSLILNEAEYSALYDIYNSTAGQQWKWSTNTSRPKWNFTASISDPCLDHWQGVICTSTNTSVSSLSLPSFEMKGRLPSSLENFLNLVTLNLSKNSLSGSIPYNQLGTLPQLQTLDLGFNHLVGPTLSVPLKALKKLVLASNALTGAFPSVLIDMTNLTYIDLGYNHMNGTDMYQQHSVFASLISLTYLNVQVNQLQGSIPLIALTNAPKLAKLHLNENYFTGTLPSEITNFRNLGLLKIRGNRLNGSIISEIGYLPKLYELHLSLNSFVGTIQSSFSKLENLNYLSLRDNKLTGTLPTFLGSMTKIYQFQVHLNLLNGTIPSALGNMSSMKLLSLFSNYFVGTIPPDLSNMTACTTLFFFNNSLTGTIPADLGKLTELQRLDLSNNFLRGTIPPELSNMTKCNAINLLSNSLTGTIPADLGKLTELQRLDLSNNFLRGTIPKTLTNVSLVELKLYANNIVGNLPEYMGKWEKMLQSIDLSSNYLTGTLPHNFSRCSELKFVSFMINQISGRLDKIFTSKTLINLETLVLSENSFMGQFPSEIFELKNFSSLYASKNCFDSFPGDLMCKATNLHTVVLDGMSVGETCSKPLTSLSQAYLPKYIDGTLPICLFNASKLTVLQLSGLGLLGTLSDIVTLPSKLSVLHLDHNNIQGTIPQLFIRQNFESLYLSANFITGLWRGLKSNKTDLQLFSNRLSGNLPQVAYVIKKMDVLRGNRFQFDAMSSEAVAPPSDVNSESVSGGSNDLDISLLIWGISLFIISALGFYFLFVLSKGSVSWVINAVRHAINTPIHTLIVPKEFYEDGNTKLDLSKLVQMINLYLILTIFILSIGGFGFVINLIVIVSLRDKGYDTHTYMYSWKYSAAFFTGQTPALVLLFFSVCVLSITNLKLSSVTIKRTRTMTDHARNSKILFFIGVINAVLVILVDVGYVLVKNSNDVRSEYKICMTIFVAVFTFSWNQLGVPFVLRMFRVNGSGQFKGRLLCRIFNLLVASTISTFLADPLCYKDLLSEPEPSLSSFVVPTCSRYQLTGGVITCLTMGVAGPFETSFIAPFLYSHNCYSAIITNYTPVVLYMSLIQLVFSPITFIVPTAILKDGNKFPGIQRMLWLPTKDFGPNKIFSYFKLPKFFSACYFYLCEVLTFGLFNPLVMLGILSALVMEIAVHAFFIRRFFVMCVKNCPSTKELDITNSENGVLTRKPTSEIRFPEIQEVFSTNMPIDTSTYYENALELIVVQNAIEFECADRTFKFIRPTIFVTFVSGIFWGCMCLDMASSLPMDWSKYIWMPFFATTVPYFLKQLFYNESTETNFNKNLQIFFSRALGNSRIRRPSQNDATIEINQYEHNVNPMKVAEVAAQEQIQVEVDNVNDHVAQD